MFRFISADSADSLEPNGPAGAVLEIVNCRGACRSTYPEWASWNNPQTQKTFKNYFLKAFYIVGWSV